MSALNNATGNTSGNNSTAGLNFHSLNQEYQIQFNRINRIMMPTTTDAGLNSGKSMPSANSASYSYNNSGAAQAHS